VRLAYRGLITATLAVALFAPGALPAAARPFAAPIAAKQAEAARVQAQVDDLINKAEMATERYNQARIRFNNVATKEEAASARIAELQKRTDKLQGRLDDRVAVMYRQGPLGVLTMLLSTNSIKQLVTTMQALTEMSRRDSVTIAQLKETKAETVTAHATLLAARREADRQQKAMASAAADVHAQEAARAKVLAGLNADIKNLLAKQKAAEEAAARARLAALLARERAARAARSGGRPRHGRGGGFNIDLGGNPPSSDKGAQAVWWAQKALGAPYRWGAAGPRSFDCSGLMMWAYRHVGVRLPHHSGSQIRRGARVSRDNLEPGDLVFFGSPIHHVGMYVGGGDFIEAPYSGSHVRISSLSHRGDFAGACRP
jgi:cell wall-associated NlpC family hydrolase